MGKRFYRTVYKITILSEDVPLGSDLTLSAIDEAINTGPCSGTVEHISSDEITAQQMALEALAQGSDPEFFDLDEDGKPVES